MTVLTLEHLSKRFTESDKADSRIIQAVDNVSLRIQSGDVLGILGPSGCGKSTLLRLLAGLIQPDSGRILYDEENLQDIPMRERGIGMVFQDGALMPHWESRRSVGLFLALRKREAEVPEKLHQIAKITGIGLDKLLERRPGQLSGGEQQRVGIARALARDMRVLLFDEPFANLDAKYRAEARVELKRLLNAFPVTSVYVTHDQVEAIALSHRIAVMRAGHMEQIGTYHQLYENPINLFVATFIGTPLINVFRGRVAGGCWHGASFGGFPVRKDLVDGMGLTAAIRPERIRVVANGTAGVVEEITPHYAERFQLVGLRLPYDRCVLTLPLDHPIRVGDTVQVEFPAEALMYFDARTETRLG
jgi:ABC-type sugar transport system ATPase subunit